jgi:hypothetical protein
MAYIVIRTNKDADPITYPIDSDGDELIAREALRDAGVACAAVWNGAPDCPDAFKSTRLLFASAGPIIREKPEGMPGGSYQVTYYRVTKAGTFKQRPDYDRDVSETYVRSMAAKLGENEALHAVCRSQPGGMWAYGSRDAEAANER